jgi:hypothetical protein
MTAGFMIEAEVAPQARQMAADGHGRSLDCSDAHVSAALQSADGVNIASCNGRLKVSESVKTSLYMYFATGKLVVNSYFNEGGSPKL